MSLMPRPIKDEAQLLVEGKDAEGFFDGLIRHLELENLQLQNFGGVDELRSFLPAFTKTSGFSRVMRIGIVRDAEENASGAFDSVQGCLRRACLPVPDTPGQCIGDRPAITVMILPGENQAGMLETLLCETFRAEPVFTCIERFLECVKRAQGEAVHRPHKTRARTFLATKPDPNLSVGNAARRGYWNLDHAALEPLRTFLRKIAAAH